MSLEQLFIKKKNHLERKYCSGSWPSHILPNPCSNSQSQASWSNPARKVPIQASVCAYEWYWRWLMLTTPDHASRVSIREPTTCARELKKPSNDSSVLAVTQRLAESNARGDHSNGCDLQRDVWYVVHRTRRLEVPRGNSCLPLRWILQLEQKCKSYTAQDLPGTRQNKGSKNSKAEVEM